MLRRAGELFTEDAVAEMADGLRPGDRPARCCSNLHAAFEAGLANGECFERAGLPTHPQGEAPTSEDARWSLARRRAAGVASAIAPFNFPLILGLRSVAPALMKPLGNAVLLKPDPRTAVSGRASSSPRPSSRQAGLPAPAVLHLSVPGDGSVGRAVDGGARGPGDLDQRVHCGLGAGDRRAGGGGC
ncbi:hypothetical protein SVIOM342S_09705 [Streptomyces violaceorubidus]